MCQKAAVQWVGTGKNGQGFISTASSVLKHIPYSFGTRFENERGTSPEELIAAAHAACFTMALTAALAKNKYETNSIYTEATVTITKKGESWMIASSNLDVKADVPEIEEAEFEAIAQEVKDSCPLSRVLRADISVEASLQKIWVKKTRTEKTSQASY